MERVLSKKLPFQLTVYPNGVLAVFIVCRQLGFVVFVGTGVGNLESDFLGRGDPPGQMYPHQEAGDVVAKVGECVYFRGVGIVFKASEVGVLFTGKEGTVRA